VKNVAGTCARELTHRGAAIPRIDRQHLSGIRTTPGPLNPFSDLTLQQEIPLFVAGTREGGVRKRPQSTSETPVAIRALIWLGVRDDFRNWLLTAA
jgi:hypothetical protein